MTLTMYLKILVRSKRDADAVRSVVRIFRVRDIKVESLGGLRGDKLAEKILNEVKPFTIVILGKEDSEIAKLVERELPPFSDVIISRTKRVRNSTPSQILSLISKGRASIRLYTSWKGTYLLSRTKSAKTISFKRDPQGDTFFIYNKGIETLSEVLGYEISGVVLAFKLSRGIHELLLGPELIARLYIGQNLEDIKVKELFGKKVEKGPDLEDVISGNRSIIKILEERAEKILKEYSEEPDTVIVPWSGGKDSTAALLIAIRVFGKDRVKPVYVDTGVDFDENRYYIEKISSLMKIEYHVYNAEIDKELMKGKPLPTPKHRWCTYRKILALRKAFSELSKGKTLVVVGDRDAESDTRAMRPVLRSDETGLPLIAPLKLWGGAHVETYILSKGLPLNPLYKMGFYRIGCYICFSLRSWELRNIIRNNLIDEILKRRPEHKDFLKRFLISKGFSTHLK